MDSKVSLLLRNAAALSDLLWSKATHPEMRDAVALVALAGRDTQSWLTGVGSSHPRVLADIELSLSRQLKRLDELDHKLRLSADATP